MNRPCPQAVMAKECRKGHSFHGSLRSRAISPDLLPLPNKKHQADWLGVFYLARPYKIDPQGKFFRNRSMVFRQRIDLPLGDDGSCTRPLSSGMLLHACKQIYVLFFSSALYFSTKASNSFIYLSSLACPLGRSSPGFLYPQILMSFSTASSVLYALNDCPEM